jgi:hypothetical protein
MKQVSAQVLQFPLQKSEAELVLEELSQRNKIIPLRDLLIIAKFEEGDPHLGVAGRYWEDPDAMHEAMRFVERKMRWHRSIQRS